MKKSYGGDLTNIALTGTLVYKNLDAEYLEPKQPWEFEKELPDYKNMSVNELLEHTPKSWKDNKSESYWKNTNRQKFSAKDGQTNAYVKRGVDEDVYEYLDREFTRKTTWQIATDDPINFIAGGKVIVGGREYFILKVILQQSTGTYQNKFFAMDTSPDNERIQLIGLKTLVLA